MGSIAGRKPSKVHPRPALLVPKRPSSGTSSRLQRVKHATQPRGGADEGTSTPRFSVESQNPHGSFVFSPLFFPDPFALFRFQSSYFRIPRNCRSCCRERPALTTCSRNAFPCTPNRCFKIIAEYQPMHGLSSTTMY